MMLICHLTTGVAFLRRPILSLMAMVLNPHHYEPDMSDSSARARLADLDLSHLEFQADRISALDIVHKIMERYHLTLDDIEKELDVGGMDWADAGDVEIDLAFLEISR
jgi:hypothetical protein